MNAYVSGEAIAFWNARANDWDSRIRADPFYEKRERVVADLVSRHVSPGASILEIGCATGTLTQTLLQRGFDAYGCDIAEEMVDVAIRRNGFRQRFCVARDGCVPFERMFAAVVAVGVFPYVAEHRRFAAHLREQLDPGGTLIASSTNRASLYTGVLLAKHLLRFTRTREWRAVAANLWRTGVWSGGFIDNDGAQCTNGRAFDAMMGELGLERIDEIDLFNMEPLDRLLACAVWAHRAAWTHIGVFRKT